MRLNSISLLRPVEREEGREISLGPATFGGPALTQEYKVQQSAPYKKQNSKIFS